MPVDARRWKDVVCRQESAERALRGGAWNNEPRRARSAYRNGNHRDNRNDNIGFRFALSSIGRGGRMAPGHGGCRWPPMTMDQSARPDQGWASPPGWQTARPPGCW